MADQPYTLIGTPFSTFTRTIALGLQYKKLKYNQIATKPQTRIAQEAHPFGYLPTLVIHEIDGKKVDVKLVLAISERHGQRQRAERERRA